jgi:hypothetical protein
MGINGNAGMICEALDLEAASSTQWKGKNRELGKFETWKDSSYPKYLPGLNRTD